MSRIYTYLLSILLFIICTTELKAISEFSHITGLENITSIREKIKATYEGRYGKCVSIAFIGDSYVDGNYYPYRLYDYFTKKTSNAGVGYLTLSNASGTSSLYTVNRYQIDFTQTLVSSSYTTSLGYGADSRHVTVGAGSKFTLTPKLKLTSIDVFYLARPNGGTISVTIADKTVVQNTASDIEEIRKLNLNFPENAENITINVDKGSVVLTGCNLRNDVPNSIRVHKLGKSGSHATGFADTTGRWSESIKHLELDVATISFGVNDTPWSTIDKYESALRTIAQNIKNANPQTDLIFIFPYKTTTSLEWSVTPMDNDKMREVMKSVARDFNGAFIDMGVMVEVDGGVVINKDFTPPDNYTVRVHSEIERLVKSAYLRSDRTHPDILGKIAYFDSIRHALEK